MCVNKCGSKLVTRARDYGYKGISSHYGGSNKSLELCEVTYIVETARSGLMVAAVYRLSKKDVSLTLPIY